MNFKVLVFILCRFTSICLLHKYMSFFLKGQALKTEVSHKKDCSSLIPYSKKLIEETLELLENLLLHRRVRFEVVRSLHLFERALFLFIERFRHIDTDVDE